MKKAMVGILVLGLMEAATGCGKAAEVVTEQVAEQIAEQAIEQDTGGDVDIEMSDEGGMIQVETDEGTATYGGGEIPEDIDVPFPNNGKVMMSATTDTESTVMVQYPGAEFEEIASFYRDWADGSGIEFEHMTLNMSGVQSEAWTGETITVSVQTCPTEDGQEGVCVFVTVEK
jgi:hypothetical protein